MDNDLIPFQRHGSPAVPTVGPAELYGALLADADCEATQKARVKDTAALGRYLGLEPARALDLVIAGSPGQANTIALGWKADMIGKKLAPNTINRRLSTLRRACRVARRLGLVEWSLDIELLHSEAYRDLRGPGLEGWRAMLGVANREAATGSPTALRDLALIHCLYDRGLRSIEVLRLELSDVDIEGRRLAVIGKGKKERSWLGINATTAAALANWIKARGTASGPLLIRTDSGSRGSLKSISHMSVWNSVRRLGKAAGLTIAARPHGLRHASTTRLLDLTGGDVRRVRHFTRHAKLETVALYDDARHDFGGQLSELLGDDLGSG